MSNQPMNHDKSSIPPFHFDGWQKLKTAGKFFSNQVSGRPLSVNLEVTKKCNARCDFCDYWKTKKENIIDDYGPIIKKVDPFMVTITGGEPLLRSDLIQLIQGIRKASPNIYMAMISNASLLTVKKATELRDAGINQLAISLDFVDERHDTSRGIPGLWKHINKVLPEVAKLGFDSVSFNWVIMEENFDQTLDAAKLADSWGMNISYSSYSDLKNMNDSHFLSKDKLERLPQLISDLKSFKTRQKNIRNSDYYLDHIIPYYNKKEIEGCPAGIKWIQITPEGWFKPCSELPPVTHWKDYDPKKSFKAQECTLCWYGCRGENQTPFSFKRIKDLAANSLR